MKLKTGDIVAYSHAWLRSIGAITGDLPRRRGVVQELQTDHKPHIARVLWDDDEEPHSVLVNNLAKPGPNVRFCG